MFPMSTWVLTDHHTRVISTILFALVVFLVYGSKDFKGLDDPRNAIMTALWKWPNANECKLQSQCSYQPGLVNTSKEPVCPRVELILKIIIILLIIFLGFIKSKPC